MNIKRIIKSFGLGCRRHAPEILIVAGSVGVVASGVFACKATLKLHDILDDSKEQLNEIQDAVEHPEKLKSEYTTEMVKSDTFKVKLHTGLEIAKLYAFPVALGTLSLASIISSHNILRKRNVALAVGYATLSEDFKEYRERVVQRFGEALDKELRYDVKTKVIEETVVDEKGKEKKVKKEINVVDDDLKSDTIRFFDESCPDFTDSKTYNITFLQSQERFFNDKLRADGFVFLNDICRALGLKLSRNGYEIGWIRDDNDLITNKISFGIYNAHKKRNGAIDIYDPTIVLEFNVDPEPIKSKFNLDPLYS